MKKEVRKLIEKIENLGWSVNIEDDTMVSLGKYSPMGKISIYL